MWFADFVLDLAWFASRDGKLGEPQARVFQKVTAPDLDTELLLYGDDEAIRHLRIMIHTDKHAEADACTNKNVRQWSNALGVASALATPTFSAPATLDSNSATFMLFLGEGGESSDTISLRLDYKAPARANLEHAARLMAAWTTDFDGHLFFLSRFLNQNLPPEYRWLNGYRFMDGTSDVARLAYRRIRLTKISFKRMVSVSINIV